MRGGSRTRAGRSKYFAGAVWAALLGATLMPLASVWADTQPEEPVLKPDIPKFDLTAPKPRTLKGGVQHREVSL